MANNQIDWTALEQQATAYKNASTLLSQIAAITPSTGFIYTDLVADLATILQAAAKVANPLSGGLVIAVDTLNIPEGTTNISASGVQIIARSIIVANKTCATLAVTAAQNPSVQIVTTEIIGDLSISLGKDGATVPVQLSSIPSPQILTFNLPSTADTVSNTTTALADIFHSPYSILAIELSFVAGATLVEVGSPASLDLAANMLRWTISACHDLLAEKSSFPDLDIDNIANLLANSSAQLVFTQAAISNAIYVPVLSAELYSAEINALLEVAEIYDSKISAFQQEENIDELLKEFTGTLNSINSDAETPLFNELVRLAAEAQGAQGALSNAAIQLQAISQTIAPLQAAVEEAIQEKFQHELLEEGLKIFFTIITLYASAGAAIADPAVLAGESGAIAKAALDIAAKLAEAGASAIERAINSGESAATGPLTNTGLQSAANGAQAMMGAQVAFGVASATLWEVVNLAIAGGQNEINFSPDIVKAVDQIPDLSGFSIGGLDPNTFWDAFVIQIKAAYSQFVNDPIVGPSVNAYFEAVDLASTYGKGIGDQQMKLLQIYNQGVSAFDRLRSLVQAGEQWNALEGKLDSQEAKINAAIGFLENGYTNVKRNIVTAVNNYRAAFNYQWLQPSTVSVNASMSFLELVQEAKNSITSLENVLVGKLTGVKPRQSFDGITYMVEPGKNPLFREVNGKGQAQWSITLEDDTLSEQLNGNTAFFITEATFELIGGTQKDEVELQVETSANYSNKVNDQSFRFVSSGFSMSSDYIPSQLPHFITKWEFAEQDAPNYLTPSPYTQWTLTVDKGNWQDVTAIKMTISGLELQNDSQEQSSKSSVELKAERI